MTNAAEATTDTRAESQLKGAFRQKVARAVILASGWILGSLTFVVGIAAYMAYDPDGPDGARVTTDIVQTYIYAILPMIGTWVGTVIAFYFTNDSFQTASSETRLTFAETRDARLRQIPVQRAMMPVSSVRGIAADDAGWQGVNFKTGVLDFLASEKIGRLPVFSSSRDRLYGIVHDSVVKDFALRHGVRPTSADAAASGATLAEFLEDGEVSPRFRNSVGFVGPDATLADVKKAMDEVTARGYPCRDVFVTDTGTPTGRPIGMITNVDLEKWSSYG